MKKILIILAIIAVALPVNWFVLTNVVIDADEMAAQLSESIHQATGRRVEVDEGASVTLFPTPSVTYRNFRIFNIGTASSQYLVKSAELVMHVDFASLLAFSAHPGKIELIEPAFDFETLPNGTRNWQFVNSENNATGFQEYFKSIPIHVKNGNLRYVNAANAFQVELEGLDGTLGYQEGGKYFAYDGFIGKDPNRAKILLQSQSVDMTQANVSDVPLQVKVEYKGVTMLTKGMVSDATREFKFVGDLDVNAKNFWALYAAASGKDTLANQKLDFSPEFGMKGKLTVSTKEARLEKATFGAENEGDIPVIKGAAAMRYTFGKNSKLDLYPVISTMDLDHLDQAYGKWFPAFQKEEKQDDIIDNVYGEDDYLKSTEGKVSPFLANIGGSLKLKIKNAIFHGRTIRDINVRGVIDGGELLIEQGQGEFPGDTKIVAQGTTKRAEDGLWFDGTLNIRGESLEQFMSAFAPKGVEIPPLDLGKFIVDTNFSYNPKQFRLSEMKAAVKNSRAAGAFIIHRGDRMRIETFLKFQGLNLDILNEASNAFLLENEEGIQTIESSDGSVQLFNVMYDNRRHDWLGRLSVDVLAQLVLDDFVLWDRKGSTAEFQLEMGRGYADITKLKAQYNGTNMKGDFGIRLDPEKNPLVSINATIDELDAVDLFPDLAKSQNDEEWADFLNRKIEFIPLQSYRSQFYLNFGKFQVKNYLLKDLSLRGSLEENVMQLDDIAGKLWDGEIEGMGSVAAGTIPAMAIGIRFTNANLFKLSQTTSLLKHAAGILGVELKLEVSGVSFGKWLENAKGSLSVRGQDVSVAGFGLSTLARAVPLARSVQDLDNAKKQALKSGSILFRKLSGTGNFEKGELNIPRMLFESEEASGEIEGKVDLIKEAVNLKVMVNLFATYEQGKTHPIYLYVDGPIDHLDKSLETQLLDAYVARKAAERTLKSVR